MLLDVLLLVESCTAALGGDGTEYAQLGPPAPPAVPGLSPAEDAW